jgi:hypothetical protein
MLKLALVFMLICSTGLICACGPEGGTYCQSGPKYGTQCYSKMDLQQPGSPPTDPKWSPNEVASQADPMYPRDTPFGSKANSRVASPLSNTPALSHHVESCLRRWRVRASGTVT